MLGIFTLAFRQLLGSDADGFFQVADFFLDFTFGLLLETLGFLLRAVDQIADFFLDFAADVFQFAFDLVFVHGSSPECVPAGMAGQ
jgi:hypothetical protein